MMEASLSTFDTGKASLHKNALTDDEIQQLLLEAEGRLQTSVSKSLDSVADSST